MKKIYLICIVLVFACNKSIKAQAPEAVKTTFKAKYPGENDPDWHKDDQGYYEAHFKIDGVKYRADFNADGSWVETETSIDEDDLPEAIKKVIKEKFDDEEITEVEKVDSATKGLFYDVEFKRKGKNKDVEFKANGKIIN
ncbi:PepSY-like domain-containing protein [Winogradskyella luteola]|uniref:PepSY-like domain-containing protein n=1 Tax=Winogradskyella luteola TaxID=2828330 RepID=A0A9X1F7L5_9FLAO|nr:PepSY-like domain-containing protein [Winogradskyella luteola]MBV7268108.1 PepSY-like domain-containing protein [Winogradskyella luteola]